MSEKIRFHLDESVNPRIGYALQAMGIDVTISKAVGLRGAADEEQWEYANLNGRVLLTHDDDFLRIASQNPNHSGLIFRKQLGHSLGAIIVECASMYS
jgi:predicted nuclease of predicted toxin-antitoxin system